MEVEMIDTVSALESFLNDLPLANDQPSLFIDLEGNKLSRHGTLSLITILIEPRHTIHLVDVHVLGSQAFLVASSNGVTLKQILESVNISKVFFDIRHDSDALYSLYGISVGGIEELQLMELATRAGGDKRHVSSLSKCIERDAAISANDKQAWKAVKERVKGVLDPVQGQSYAAFDQRPLSLELERYAVQDVVHMPDLHKKYDGMLTDQWRETVQLETTARIVYSQSADFVAGKHLRKGPKAWNPDVPKRKGKGKGRGRWRGGDGTIQQGPA